MKIDLVDVFGSGALSGNPLAVVHGGDDLSADQMLALTQWLGFSETTFLLPPSDPAADYRARIFYPGGELPFAGHPTLGSCYAWMAAGGSPQQDGAAIQECGVGLVEVRRDGTQLAFKAPPFTRQGPLTEDERENAIKLTGVNPDAVVEAVHVQNGPQWQLLRLSNAADVLAADPASKAPLGTDIGLAGPYEQGADADWELRAFFANANGRFVEDPVTGSFNAGVAMHLFGSGLARGSYRAAQGRKTGADGLVDCRQETDGSIWIGGRCAMVSQGGALLPIA
uniref:PhzF family phenazine biosynthesis protein n=1 Tax=uncultured Altererythrobacter sp. TaxID=500840 RepID=UPI0026239198|nr:PhzF family phenazine biosynthesis protein [uncultured Altererythrobacter sp.]